MLNAEEAEGRRDFSDQLLHFLAALFKQIPDEKGAEDIHQHVRDIPPGDRNKGVSSVSLFNACIQSGVIESRSVRDCAVSVPDQDVALQGWHSVTEKPHLRTQVVMPPVDWPMGLNKLLDPKYKFPTPTFPTFFNSMLVWQRLLSVGRNDRYEEGTKSWWSRLCRNGQVLKLENGGAYMVLVVGQ